MIFVLCLIFLTLASTIEFSNSSFKSSINFKSSFNKLSKHLSNLYALKYRIIGGTHVRKIDKYPFMALLKIEGRVDINATAYIKKTGSCGASIISPSFVLTAAHCVKHCRCNGTVDDADCKFCKVQNVKDLTIYVGNLVITKYSTNVKNVSVTRLYIHPQHKTVDILHGCMERFDVAVLKLSKPLQFSKGISSVKLPKIVTLGKDNLLYTKTNKYTMMKKHCVILGWGITGIVDSKKNNKPALKVAKVSLLGMHMCLKDFEQSTDFDVANSMCTDTHLCSKSSHYKDGICKGDSGGPIICGGVQVGVTSVAFRDCVGPHLPNMYTRVDINVDWIKRVMSGTEKT